jgi:hypothetical protein
MSRFISREHREVAKWAAEHGWTWRYTGAGNVMFRHPSGLSYTAASTPRSTASWVTTRIKLRNLLLRAPGAEQGQERRQA